MKIDYNRKDCSPQETIKTIKNILKKNKIKVKESKVININNSIYSVRIELKDLKGIGTNGKGITKEYALASGYAEFMERLQSRNLIKTEFLNKVINAKLFKDEYYLDYEDFVVKFKDINLFNNYKIKELLKNNEDYRYYTKFYDILNEREVDLPIKIINMLSHSNGLCAGNSKKEALIQGICEIFERYVYRELIIKEKEIPNIKVNSKEIQKVSKQLKLLNSMGFKYQIKDCSLNGKYPVVGLMIFDKDKQNYLFSIGADPNFEIALQRCITEIFQGLSKNHIDSKLKPINNDYELKKKQYSKEFIELNWLKCYTSNNGIHPKNFFISKKFNKLNELNFTNENNNYDVYNYILNIIEKNDLKLYVKDYSILGFNTYKVYIPELSDIDVLDDVKVELYNKIKQLKKYYYNFLSVKGKNNEEYEKILEMLSKSMRYSDLIVPYNLFDINHYVDNNYVKLNYFYLLIIELIINKKYSKAIKIIEEKVKTTNISNFEKEYLSYLMCKLSGKEKIRNEYSKNIIEDINFMVENTEKYLKNLNIMECPDCSKCRNKGKCKYNEWIRINNILNCY